jgi:hypothetical protein
LLSGAYNVTIRAVARGGELARATELLEQALNLEHLILDNSTVGKLRGWAEASMGVGDRALKTKERGGCWGAEQLAEEWGVGAAELGILNLWCQ